MDKERDKEQDLRIVISKR